MEVSGTGAGDGFPRQRSVAKAFGGFSSGKQSDGKREEIVY